MAVVEGKPGARFRSAVCTTEVVMVKAGGGPVDLCCGGAPMVAMDGAGEPTGAPAPGFDGGTAIGKRFVDADEAIEVLCTKAGAGTLSIGPDALTQKGAKPLPSSD